MTNEIDSIHILECTNERIVAVQNNMFQKMLTYFQQNEGQIEVLQVILDHLYGKSIGEYQSESYKKDLYQILLRYVWHGFFPITVVESIHKDRLKAHRITLKLIKIC